MSTHDCENNEFYIDIVPICTSNIPYCCLMWLKFDRTLDATGWPSFVALYSAPRKLKFFLNAAVFPFHQDPKFELIYVILIT